MCGFPLPRLSVGLALLILAGEIIAVLYYGGGLLKNEVLWGLAGGIFLALILLIVGYRPPCSLYYEWSTAPYQEKSFLHAARRCGKESVGCIRTTRTVEYLDDAGELHERPAELLAHFCSEHDPSLSWMSAWMGRERIRIYGSARYYKK